MRRCLFAQGKRGNGSEKMLQWRKAGNKLDGEDAVGAGLKLQENVAMERGRGVNEGWRRQSLHEERGEIKLDTALLLYG